GRITAQNQTPSGTQGGQIHVTGEQVRIASTAQLDASAPAGGGEVLIGGGWQGNDSRLSNALNTLVEAGAKLSANATQRGNGGTIVLWSDGLTQAHGTLSARGGPEGGNGGQVETSGSTLQRSGLPDVSAPMGQAGLWLLDPDFIELAGGPIPSPGPVPGPFPSGQPLGGATVLYETELEQFVGNIALIANHAIVATTANAFNGGLQIRSGLTLSTVNAPGPVPVAPMSFKGFNQGIDLTATGFIQVGNSLGSPGNVLITAGTDMLASKAVQLHLPNVLTTAQNPASGPGNITLRSSGSIRTGNLTTKSENPFFGQGGSVTVDASGGVADVGAITTSIRDKSFDDSKAGDITVLGKSVVLRGNLDASGFAPIFETTGSAPGNIQVIAGLNCDASCDTVPTLLIAPDGSGSLNISAVGGIQNTMTGIKPARGGNVILQALRGDIAGADPMTALFVNTEGANYFAGPPVGFGSDGGQVMISAEQGRIANFSLVLASAAGGQGAEEGRFGAPVGRPGGHGGSVSLRAANGILVDNLQLLAQGGHGGKAVLAGESRTAGSGGNGGNVTLLTAGGALVNPGGSLVIRANGGAGGNAEDFAAGIALPGAGGNGGTVEVKAPHIAFFQPFSAAPGSVIEAVGGQGGFDSMPFGLSGSGGNIALTATAPDGGITLTDAPMQHQLLTANPMIDSPFGGSITLSAGSGGILLDGQTLVATDSLVLLGNNGLQDNLGSVELPGPNTVGAISGKVLGAGSTLRLRDTGFQLDLGYSDVGLAVDRDIFLTYRPIEGGDLRLAHTVESKNGSITLKTDVFRLAYGDFPLDEKLVAKQDVVFETTRTVRLNSLTRMDDSEPPFDELALHQDTLRRIDAPRLFIDQSGANVDFNPRVVFGASNGDPTMRRVKLNDEESLKRDKVLVIATPGQVVQTEPFDVTHLEIDAGAIYLGRSDLAVSANRLGDPDRLTGALPTPVQGSFRANASGIDTEGSDTQAVIELRNTAGGQLVVNASAVSNLNLFRAAIPEVAITSTDAAGNATGDLLIGVDGITSGRIKLVAQNIYNAEFASGFLRTIGTGESPVSSATLSSLNAVPGGQASIELIAGGSVNGPASGFVRVEPGVTDGVQTLVRVNAGTAGGSGADVLLDMGYKGEATFSSTLDVTIGGDDTELSIQTPGSFVFDVSNTPANLTTLVVQAGAGQPLTEASFVRVNDGVELGFNDDQGGNGTKTIVLRGGNIELGQTGASQIRVRAGSLIELEAFGQGAGNGNITLQPEVLVEGIASSGYVTKETVLTANDSILGEGLNMLASRPDQIRAGLLIATASKDVRLVGDVFQLVLGDLSGNPTGGADSVQFTNIGSSALSVLAAGNPDGLLQIDALSNFLGIEGDLPTRLSAMPLQGSVSALAVVLTNKDGSIGVKNPITVPTGTGGIDITSFTRDVFVANTSLTTANGNISLTAKDAFSSIGIKVFNAQLDAGTAGRIDLLGASSVTSGGVLIDSSTLFGGGGVRIHGGQDFATPATATVQIASGSNIASGNNKLHISGTQTDVNPSSANLAFGVGVFQSTLSTQQGEILLDGQVTGGTAPSKGAAGVVLEDAFVLSSSGAINITGVNGNNTLAAAPGLAYGVFTRGNGQIGDSTGTVTITGQVGTGAGFNSHGVSLGQIVSNGGEVHLTGSVNAPLSDNLVGVGIVADNLISTDGDLKITGNVVGAGVGVQVLPRTVVQTTRGALEIQGNVFRPSVGTAGGGLNAGVDLQSQVQLTNTATAGTIDIIGTVMDASSGGPGSQFGVAMASGPLNTSGINAEGRLNISGSVNAPNLVGYSKVTGVQLGNGPVLSALGGVSVNGGVTLGTAPSGAQIVRGVSLAAVVSTSGGDISVTSASGSVAIFDANLGSDGGAILVKALDPYTVGAAAVTVSSSVIESQAGTVTLLGSRSGGNGAGVLVAGNSTLEASGGIAIQGGQNLVGPVDSSVEIVGSRVSGRGFQSIDIFGTQAQVNPTVGPSAGLSVRDSTIEAEMGRVTLMGAVLSGQAPVTADGASGVRIENSAISAQGNIDIIGNDGAAGLTGPTGLVTGALLRGSSPITTAVGGNIFISGNVGAAAANGSRAVVVNQDISSGGNLDIDGVVNNPLGQSFIGIEVQKNINIDAVGSISLTGDVTGAGDGVKLRQGVGLRQDGTDLFQITGTVTRPSVTTAGGSFNVGVAIEGDVTIHARDKDGNLRIQGDVTDFSANGPATQYGVFIANGIGDVGSAAAAGRIDILGTVTAPNLTAYSAVGGVRTGNKADIVGGTFANLNGSVTVGVASGGAVVRGLDLNGFIQADGGQLSLVGAVSLPSLASSGGTAVFAGGGFGASAAADVPVFINGNGIDLNAPANHVSVRLQGSGTVSSGSGGISIIADRLHIGQALHTSDPDGIIGVVTSAGVAEGTSLTVAAPVSGSGEVYFNFFDKVTVQDSISAGAALTFNSNNDVLVTSG
ncbi:MAG: beta strand repeat-containing protein, partial [Burkholderiaceae bacterium]